MARIEDGYGTVEAPVSSGVEKFATPEEELVYLRERIKQKEQELEVHSSDFEKERIAKREIQEYQDTPAEEVLHDRYKTPESQLLRDVLKLEPDEHDAQVEELLKMIPERGVKNTLDMVRKMGSAHIEDDLHRALIAYVAEGMSTKGVKQGSETWKALHMTLYEVSLPGRTAEDAKEQQGQDIEKLLAAMEQFYAGLLSVVGTGSLAKKHIFSVEMAVQQGSEEVIFYVSVPRAKKELFEKHLISIYPNARLSEVRGDYNIFNYGGGHSGAYAELARNHAYPLKDYSEFTQDPLNVMLSAFSKLSKSGEGAAVQFIIGDNGDTYNHQYKEVLRHLREGKKAQKAVSYGTTATAQVIDDFKKALGDIVFNRKTVTPEERQERTVDQFAMEAIEKKAENKVVPVNIRIIASASDQERAQAIVEMISSTFNQFEDAQGNALRFIYAKSGAEIQKFINGFIFRTLNVKRIIPLSLRELTALYHLTGQGVSTSRELKQSRAKQVAAPLQVAPEDTAEAPQRDSRPPAQAEQEVPPPVARKSGIILGKNTFGGTETLVTFSREDRMRHFYEIGQTGTGKTNLMKNMIIQDIQNGEGCCYIDPHGSDIIDVLGAVPPERYQDVIYFDPSHTKRPMGLNMMEFNPEFPEQKTFVVNEIFSIFEKLFLAKSPESLGPMFEQYFRNAAMLVLEGMPPNTATLADIPRVLANAEFRNTCLANSKNPLVNQFWEEIAQKAGGEASLENIVPYITAKTDIFLSNDTMRPIISQPVSAFNFRKVMDERKILLVNLSKGRLGDLNAELLGLMVVGKFLQAALSRVDAVAGGQKDISDFYLYIDEFQNFTTPSIATILSEARKYRLSLNVAHQFIAQLDEGIRDAVFGNVGTKCVFRVGTEDAEFLEKQFQPDFAASDIAGLENFNAYISLLVNGVPVKPFNIVTLPPVETDLGKVEELKNLSYERYGRPREEIDAEIAEKYLKPPPVSDSGNGPIL